MSEAICRNVIVSGYFKIPGKLTHLEYKRFLIRFFRATQKCTVVFFTTQEIRDELETLVKCSDSVRWMLIKGPQEWKAWCDPKLGMEFWKKQAERDPEKHSPLLAAMWYEKAHFVLRAAELSGFPLNVNFIWCDAGCIRTDKDEKVASSGFGQRWIEAPDHKLHLQCVAPDEPQQLYYIGFDKYIGAGIMLGSCAAWMNHVRLYDDMLKHYDTEGYCGSKDQHIIHSCVDNFPNNYILHQIPKDLQVDLWFFFLQTI